MRSLCFWIERKMASTLLFRVALLSMNNCQPPFSMIPDLFIWIEFRGIARKIGQRDCSLALFGKSLDCPKGVIGSVIGNDDDGTTGIGQQLLHEGNKLPGVHLVLDNAKAHVSTGAHCGDQFQGETISAVFDHRRLSDRCPGAPTMVITAHRRFIDEVNLRPRALRQSPQLWKRLIEVTLQFLRILLIGAIDWPLRGQAHILQKATDRAFAQFHALLFLQHCSNDVESPQTENQLKLPWISQGDSLIEPLHRFRTNFSRSPPASTLL